jgi:UDP-glucuronate 4-epimerase
MRHVLVTGGAGFIGSHLIDALLAAGWQVTTIDNFDPFYPREVKLQNLERHSNNPAFRLIELDISDFGALQSQLSGRYDCIVHLAAKAGVRPSIEAPAAYQRANVAGTQNMLEFAKLRSISQFIFASSSSVYGLNPSVPWCETDQVLMPISPYAATKVAGELMGHVYSHLYHIRFIALRFFTVYGPRQRPDLAIHKFAHLLTSGLPIPVYGDLSSRRDYTFVEDIVRGIRSAMEYTGTLYEVINLGNSSPVSLNTLIREIETAFGATARLERHPEQPGDVPQTFADTRKAERLLGFRSGTTLSFGIAQFADWFQRLPGLASEQSLHHSLRGLETAKTPQIAV